MTKPDFNQMTRKELRSYVLAHREDDEAFAVLVRTFEGQAPERPIAETEKAFQEMLERLKQKHDSEVA